MSIGRGRTTLLSMWDEPARKMRRRPIESLYTIKSVRESEHHIHKPLKTFLDHMTKRSNEVIDVAEWMTLVAVGGFATLIGRAVISQSSRRVHLPLLWRGIRLTEIWP
jgi:predicted metal-dependent RNase